LDKDFRKSLSVVWTQAQAAASIEEFMDQHEDQPASETGKAKLHWRLRWMLFIGASVIVGTWII